MLSLPKHLYRAMQFNQKDYYHTRDASTARTPDEHDGHTKR